MKTFLLMTLTTFSLLALAAVSACSSDEEKPLPPYTADQPNQTIFEVKYKPATIIIDAATVESTFLLADSKLAIGEYVFRSGNTAIDALKINDIVVFTNVGLFKILEERIEGDKVVFTTEQAALTDAIDEGKITWDVGFDPKNPPQFVLINDEALKADTAGLVDGVLHYSGTIADFAVDFTLTPKGEMLDIKFTAKYNKGAAKCSFSGKGTIRGFRSTGSIELIGGEMKNLTLKNVDLLGDINFEMGAAELGKSEKLVSVPAKIAIPFTLGPLPAFTAVGGALEVDSTVGVQSSAIAKAHLTFRGSAGLELRDGKMNALGSLDDYSLTFSGGDQVSTVKAGLGMLLSFPKVELGIGLPGTGGSIYLKIKNEVVSNIAFKVEAAGTYPVITGNCRTVDVNVGGYMGGELKVFNFTLANKEFPLWAKTNQAYKDGSKCDEIKM